MKRAKGYCDNIEFSPEDAARTEPDFLCQVVEAAIDAGRHDGQHSRHGRLRHADALRRRHQESQEPRAEYRPRGDQRALPQRPGPGGGQQPGGRRKRRRPDRVHDQRHRRAGRQLLAGRSRDGDANAVAITTTPRPTIHTTRLVPTSRLLSNITGLQVQRNKAIVGRNAFAHEAGIHQDGMLKERTTYEIMRPEDVGFTQTDLVLGKHSGRAALADRAKALGYHLTGEQLQAGVRRVQEAGRQEEGSLRRRHRRADREADDGRATTSGSSWRTKFMPPAAASRRFRSRSTAAAKRSARRPTGGDGPLDALFRTIEEITGTSVVVRDFRVHSVTRGKDAQGESTIEVEREGRVYRGRGVSTDTVEAATLAFLNAVNRAAAGGGQPAAGPRPDMV